MPQILDQPIFHRLVVGADGSEEAHDAVALAAGIADASGADVSLLNVYPTSLFPIRGMTDRQTVRRLAEKTLQNERRRWDMAASVHTTSDVSIPRALSHHAEQWKADLIVVGSGRNAEAGHMSLSSRARQLLGSGRFGLAVAQRGISESKFQLRRIGVGFDSGPEAKLAMEVGAGLARRGGLELRVLSVVDDRLPVLSAGQWMTLDETDLEEMWESQRKQAAKQAEQAAAKYGVKAKIEAVRGEPAGRLREFSRQVDLLVIGSRRWGTLARVLAGSVGEALVGDAECSLLIVPRPTSAGHRFRHTAQVEEPAEQPDFVSGSQKP